MGTNLDFLAVSQRAIDQVSFIDIDPTSATFHSIVGTVAVGDAPVGIAADPGNEDIFVCNEGDSSVSIIDIASKTVRKVVARGLDRPFAVAITQRQTGFGFQRNVYFAYILDRSGHVSLFESGPYSVNGWGFDNIIGRFPFVFENPKAIQADPLDLRSAVWIVHTQQLHHDGTPTGLRGGAVSKLVFESGLVGTIGLSVRDFVLGPHLRDMVFGIGRSIGSDQLSGLPLDIAFDDQRNLGALANFAAYPAAINGKSQVRNVVGSGIVNTNEATYMFLPTRNGFVDVISMNTGLRIDTNAFHPGIQSIPRRAQRSSWITSGSDRMENTGRAVAR